MGAASPVDIVCLNTSLLGQVKDAFQGQGFVGDDQLRDAANEIEWDEKQGDHTPRAFRIVVIHHHLIPVIFREIPFVARASSVLYDAEALTRWIVKHRVDLVLHGHMHEPFLARLARRTSEGKWHTFHVAAVGSAGVHADHLGDERYNTYAYLEFSRESVRITVRRINPKLSIPGNQALVWQVSLAYRQDDD